MKKIKVIGAGGIGSILVPLLARFLDTNKEGAQITIIDGDEYEIKNRSRQLFDQCGNKAEVTARRLAAEFKNVSFKAQAEYVTNKSILYLLDDEDIIFMCVDNHKTRKLVSDFCEQELEDVVLFSGGNEFTDGNIQVFARNNGENMGLPIANHFHEEIVNPRDKRPDELGCGELVISAPQLIFTNNFIAALMLNAFYSYFYQKGCKYNEVYADIITNNCRALTRA